MKKLRRLAAGVLLPVLAITAIVSAKRLAAELAAQDARYQVGRWLKGKAIPDAAALATAEAGFRSALAYDPGNPHLHAEAGRFLVWKSAPSTLAHDQALALRREALTHFQRAARRMPTSSHAWNGVATTRVGALLVDREFVLALEQGLRWWPRHADVQMTGIRLGLATWQVLDEPTRHLVATAIRRQAEWVWVDQKPALVRLLKAYERPELGCPWAGAALSCPAG